MDSRVADNSFDAKVRTVCHSWDPGGKMSFLVQVAGTSWIQTALKGQ